MSPNTKLFTEPSGRIKLFSIIAGAIAVGLTVEHYFSNITEEEAFFGSIVTCLAISVVLAVGSLLGLLESANGRKVDKAYHILAAVLLIITASLFIVSVDKYKNSGGKNFYARRAAAGAFGLLQGVICGYTGWLLI